MNEKSEPEFATIAEICERLNVTRGTVEAWLLAGELPHYRFGQKLIRIRKPDLERFINERLVPPDDVRSRCSTPEDARPVPSPPPRAESPRPRPDGDDDRAVA